MSLAPGAGMNLFWGANGQGKTNLLEALYVTLRGKSFRPYATRADWIPQKLPDEGPRFVRLELEDVEGYPLDCRMHFNPRTSKWEYGINGKRATPLQIRERVPAVVFSPDDHALIRGAPELRRSYLDEVFTDVCPGYGEVLARFERALKSRNRLLRSLAASEMRTPTAEIQSWTKVLAAAATELSLLRQEIWTAFQERFERVGRDLFRELGTGLRIQFEADFDLVLGRENFAQVAAYQSHIEASWAADLATGWTHRGPHRDDFSISLNGVEARSGASQGQARLLALLLKWVHAEWVREERAQPPLFFIDDLSSELDSERRKRLLNMVKSLSGQIFVTGTEPSVVDSSGFLDYTSYLVKNGSLSDAEKHSLSRPLEGALQALQPVGE